MRIHKGDTVLIISGNYRGRKGKVLRALPKEKKVVVEGINLVKRHQRASKRGEKGQIVEMPASISVSNVKLICSQCGKATRTGHKILKGEKQRICKKCGRKT